ncbi:hypothetical protein [Halomonas organivorans]|uniref:Uncharacterized protein n=1 Tax=Halomonas organivorans TaxID=257772 RepID=A0A7W5BY82_9GAMM|nr:hypothetical protein [Halomonas organivorans]MBB3141241.1 hypothetical protein [Halomonas organivorans]
MHEEHEERIPLEGDIELQRALLAIQEEYGLASIDQATEFLLKGRMNKSTTEITGAPPALYLVKPQGGHQ